MSKKKIVQIVSIALFLVAVFLLIPFTDWKNNTSVICFLSLVLATFASIISIFIPTGYTYSFKEIDWKIGNENDFVLVVKANKHGIGNHPQVQVFRKKDDSFEEVEMAYEHKENGNIIISANIAFAGKVIIK